MIDDTGVLTSTFLYSWNFQDNIRVHQRGKDYCRDGFVFLSRRERLTSDRADKISKLVKLEKRYQGVVYLPRYCVCLTITYNCAFFYLTFQKYIIIQSS